MVVGRWGKYDGFVKCFEVWILYEVYKEMEVVK